MQLAKNYNDRVKAAVIGMQDEEVVLSIRQVGTHGTKLEQACLVLVLLLRTTEEF